MLTNVAPTMNAGQQTILFVRRQAIYERRAMNNIVDVSVNNLWMQSNKQYCLFAMTSNLQMQHNNEMASHI